MKRYYNSKVAYYIHGQYDLLMEEGNWRNQINQLNLNGGCNAARHQQNQQITSISSSEWADWWFVVCRGGCGPSGDWLVGLVVFDLWVKGGCWPHCSAKRRQTNQNQPIDQEFLSLGWNEMESNKEMELGCKRRINQFNSWIKKRNKIYFVSLVDEMNWVGYGRQRPSPRRELLHCFIIHSAIPQLCLAAPRRKDEPTPFSSLHFRGAQPKRKWKRRAG